MCFIVGQKVSIRLNRSAYVASYGRPTDMNFLTKAEPLRKPKWERAFSECPKCGARGRCDKHGLTASGIDLRARGRDRYADKPYMKDLFYIRGIIRNRCYCNDQKCIKLLEEAFQAGIHIEDMKQLALTTKSWTTWHRTMTDWINGDEGE